MMTPGRGRSELTPDLLVGARWAVHGSFIAQELPQLPELTGRTVVSHHATNHHCPLCQ